ncbi:zinc finger protein jing [Pieris brassicae]|uniref:zinc finger protein jing n=1 Tax=Pieris brassicae TaxID=7116 RepID=UPI001E6628F5|nr:zinc finger protein jing [Pieris brassicae]
MYTYVKTITHIAWIPLVTKSASGVAVLSPPESSGCSSSDITEPRSPRSPESGCSSEESLGSRMPPWASEPAPRRLAAQPAPLRRPNPVHRRITEYFNHKMKPQNGLKRDASHIASGDSKKKCLPKNGVTQDLEKYISYLSQTLNPKVLLDVGKQPQTTHKSPQSTTNGETKIKDLSKSPLKSTDSVLDFCRTKDNKEVQTMNGFVEVRQLKEKPSKEKFNCGVLNGLTDNKKTERDKKLSSDPSAKVNTNLNKQYNISNTNCNNKVPISDTREIFGVRIAPATSMNQTRNKVTTVKTDSKINGTVNHTAKLDSRMNGVTRGSNNLNLVNKPVTTKKETVKKTTLAPKRTNRKSSACIANSKNLSWSKANNLKQVQLQKQNCLNSVSKPPLTNMSGEASAPPKMNIPNGVRQVSMTVNGNLSSLNVPVNHLHNGHQINVQQQCNGTVSSTTIPAFMAVPQNVMLTTLRIPQNGLTAPNINQQGGIATINQGNITTLNQQGSIGALNQQSNVTFNRPNVTVTSPTKINGQFVFPLVQNINGTVVQIPNLMAKMPNFVLPQAQPLTAQRQNHLQNQQTQILINGTLLKLSNAIPSSFPATNKTNPVSSQPVLNKSFPGIQTVNALPHQKPNFNVNLSHPMLLPQPGFIVTSVPNVKETWSYSTVNTACLSQSTYSNPIVHHPPPIVPSFSTQALHSSSIPIAPVKPPDNPIQGTEPPSSTVKESDLSDLNQKCDIPWLSKNVNNNIVSLDTKKITSRPFAEIGSAKLAGLMNGKIMEEGILLKDKAKEVKMVSEELKKVEEVSRCEDAVFTHITVLKEVSSNVESTMIEANYSSATTESSESGIGTDKSIDSPSDSQGSKECDEDSSLMSLSVSVSSLEQSQSESQKSPLLKQPKILRFPPKFPVKSDSRRRKSNLEATTTVVVCHWEKCQLEFDSDTNLLEHLQAVHVETQNGKQNYVCLWEKCKVRGKPSCSRLWLERHTLSHGGNKPFKCIVDGCDRRFSTQTLLERHVNHHFNQSSQSNGSNRKSNENGSKLIRRNGKKLRYRRQPWSARMFDFFDTGMMQGLQWRLLRCTRWRLGGSCPLREPPGRHTITLHAALTATRYNAIEGRREALLTYYPPNVIEDEWVPEEDVKRVKRVEISELPAHTKVILYDQFCSSYKKTPTPPPVKKPAPQPTRQLPLRQCTSSRLLNNLLAKQKATEAKNECSATNLPMMYAEDDSPKCEVSGAKKRKLGRRQGGNAFWPSGR